MARRNWNKVFVTGGTSFTGLRVVTTLVNAGADVTVLVRPENQDRLGPLRRHIRMVSGDVWNIASLKGRSRGHGVVIHLVGSMRAQPERGQTFHQLNLVSARNAISMAISDGVPYFIMLSAANRPPGVPMEYLHTKRQAEAYLRTSGLRWVIVRAPVLFDRDQPGGHFFVTLSRVGALPFLRVFFGRRAPLPADIVARGITRAALTTVDLPPNQELYAPQLRRLGREIEAQQRRPRVQMPQLLPRREREALSDLPDDETPFGWLPPKPQDEE